MIAGCTATLGRQRAIPSSEARRGHTVQLEPLADKKLLVCDVVKIAVPVHLLSARLRSPVIIVREDSRNFARVGFGWPL